MDKQANKRISNGSFGILEMIEFAYSSNLHEPQCPLPILLIVTFCLHTLTHPVRWSDTFIIIFSKINSDLRVFFFVVSFFPHFRFDNTFFFTQDIFWCRSEIWKKTIKETDVSVQWDNFSLSSKRCHTFVILETHSRRPEWCVTNYASIM